MPGVTEICPLVNLLRQVYIPNVNRVRVHF